MVSGREAGPRRPRLPTLALVTGVTPAAISRRRIAGGGRNQPSGVYLMRERHRSDAVNEPRRVAAAAAAGEAGKGAGDELQRWRLLGNSENDDREGGCMNWRSLRVPTASRSTAENPVELNTDRNGDDERHGGDVLRPRRLS